MDIAVVGTGIAGLVAARTLHREHRVTMFEARDRPGGHARTVGVSLDGTTYPVEAHVHATSLGTRPAAWYGFLIEPPSERGPT